MTAALAIGADISTMALSCMECISAPWPPGSSVGWKSFQVSEGLVTGL